MTETDSSPGPSQEPREPSPSERTDRAHLDRSLTHGVAWMGSIKWLTQLLTWVSTLVVARLLTPADYGLVGLAAMYLGMVTLLSEFGIGTTIISLRELTPDDHAQINTLSMMFGVASFVISCAVAPALASFFDAPQLTMVIIAMGSIFLITGARVVPQALLQRDMRFRDLAINDGVQALALAAGSVLFAYLGFRYWTLVLSAVLGAIFSTAGILRLQRLPFRWPKWKTLAPAVHFSRQTITGRLAWYAYQNADFFVAGKVLGKDPLGAYKFGWDLASAPIEKITSLVGRVTPSILSAAQRDKPALRRYLLRITEALALATFPTTIGLGLVAEDVVLLALGEKWRVMIAPLQLLSIAAAIRSVTPILPQILTVIGENRRAMQVSVAGAIIMPIAFYTGSHWGTVGLAAGWLLVYPIVVVAPMASLVFRRI
ncbi:MAG: lipopolysaccharide biosynthesis protein, partial [Gemmatimonadaceae bacterium]